MSTRATSTIAGLILGLLVGAHAEPALGQQPASGGAVSSGPARNPEGYNLPNSRLAIEGYDPVAYFPEGGGSPAKGDKRFEATEKGVTYRFASQANVDLFRANPGKYEPAHGGWCTYAMGADGSKVEVDPKSFLVTDNRLFLFYKGLFNDTRSSFLKDQAALTTKADANWKSLTGEDPRTGLSPTLQRRLDELREKFSKAAPAEQLRVYEEGIRQVAASGVLESALKVGATAADFTLTNAKGQNVRLADLLKSGPVVLTWYRGGWCPYCNLQLRAYHDALPDIRSAGGRLVAISPELPDHSLTTQEKNNLEFDVLSDPGNKVAHQYGAAYRLPESLVSAFRGKLDLPAINGDGSWELPLAVTYVIGMDSRIAYAFVDADYRRRAEPADIVAALRGLRGR